jgi:hypothetical protein
VTDETEGQQQRPHRAVDIGRSPMSLYRLSTCAAMCIIFAAAPPVFAQQDLRSPDTRDAAEASKTDLRNPDTREIAESGAGVPEVTVVKVPAATSSAEDGLDWGDAGIGAGGMLGLVLLAAGATLAVMHRRPGDERLT